MYTVYVLRDSRGRFYKGMTNDLSRRLQEHRSGQTRSTKYLKNLQVAYTEEFEDSAEARRREKYFKTAAGRRFLKKYLGP